MASNPAKTRSTAIGKAFPPRSRRTAGGKSFDTPTPTKHGSAKGGTPPKKGVLTKGGGHG